MSRATISLVLRGGEGPSEITRQKVLDASQRIGYRPNTLVRSIRSGKTRMIGVLAQPNDSYWRDICYGIHDRLIESDHTPLFLWNNNRLDVAQSAEFSLQQIHRLVDHWVDGVIAWPFFAEVYADHLKEFQIRNIPLVTIDHPVSISVADVVGSDERQFASLVMGHLAELGHRRILVVSGSEGISWADERCAAMKIFWTGQADARVEECRVPLERDASFSAVARIKHALMLHPDTSAVVACTDLIAKNVYTAAAELGWNIPRRLSVVGVADLDFAALMSPPLTTVRQNGYTVGRQAAQVQLERGTGLLTGKHRRFKMPGELILRSSTTAFANGTS